MDSRTLSRLVLDLRVAMFPNFGHDKLAKLPKGAVMSLHTGDKKIRAGRRLAIIG